MKKMNMYRTFKVVVFGEVRTANGTTAPVAKAILNSADKTNHLCINNDVCDLRTVKERYNPDTKTLIHSAVENILTAESFLTRHYGKRVEDTNALYDFITVDCSGGNDYDPQVRQIKDLLCYDGLYVPLGKLEAVGYIPHNEAEIAEIDGVRYIRYRAAMQSASENRQCKLTMTTYRWSDFARRVSGNAGYLYEPTQTAQKAIARQGLAKTNGNIVKDFAFSYALVPDLELDITFNARCFNDADNTITSETITAKRNANDGCGFITPAKAKELAARLELNYIPSAFQIRYGQVKGVLIVFDYNKYSNGAIKEDILFTKSMWKADFDSDKAEFLVANVSKEPRNYAEWNYQMFTTLNNQLSFDDILPYVEDIKHYMERALSSPEDALKFLGILNNIASLDGDDSNNEYACVDKVSAVIQANPQLALNVRWVKQSIKKKIDLVSKKMLGGKLPMPQSGISIMAPDPLAFFNRLLVDEAGGYGFTNGVPVVPAYRQSKELSAREFYRGGYIGELLAFRNPLTHHAQIRKLNCVSRKDSAYWYRHLGQAVLFNAFDETAAGMGGSDFDGDMCFLTSLFTDKFRQADYIICNVNDTGSNQTKVVLTEEIVRKGIRANLQQNMLGLICNINTRCLELMNDRASLNKFVQLAGYMGDKSFGYDKIAQMPYFPKFKDTDTAAAYLEKLNHELTTLSELEVDRPKTDYINRFFQNQQEYALPYMPYWFGNIKGQLEPFYERPAEVFGKNNYGEQVRTLSKTYGKTVKVIHDAHKNGRHSGYVQRTIELLTDGNTIMSNVQRFVRQEILDMEVDTTACYSIVESLKAASILDMAEVERIMDEVRPVYKSYCHSIAANIRAMKDGALNQDEFDDALEYIINESGEKLRNISADRAALAFTSYSLSLESGYSSQSFPFLTVLDGMVALLTDVKTTEYYEFNLRREIPAAATHIIVYNRRCRLPESICPDKTYFGDVNLPNGSYELHRDLKGSVSLIVPKPVSKDKLNIIPYNEFAPFSLKVSYKASELASEHQNGEYVTKLLANGTVTIRETTMGGNIQYCVYANDIWCGTLFDDQQYSWVLKKEVARTLIGKEYTFLGVPRTGIRANSNSFITSNGNPRTAQVLTFVQSNPAATLTAAI